MSKRRESKEGKSETIEIRDNDLSEGQRAALSSKFWVPPSCIHVTDPLLELARVDFCSWLPNTVIDGDQLDLGKCARKV